MLTPSPPPINKRKLDERSDDLLPATRMRKDGNAPVPVSQGTIQEPRRLQFFVRMVFGETLVVRAYPSETVQSIYDNLESTSNVCLAGQGLIYRGRQLQAERTLGECGVENDATLHFIGRMRSTGYPRAWQLMNDVVALILDLNNNTTTISDATHSFNADDEGPRDRRVKSMLEEYLSMMLDRDFNPTCRGSGHLKVFCESLAAAALVMLYMSPVSHNRDMADEAIRDFISMGRIKVPQQNHCSFVKVVLEFCSLLRARGISSEDSLYDFCRSNLGAMFRECMELKCNVKNQKRVEEIFPFVSELADKLSLGLPMLITRMEDVKDLATFLVPLRNEIQKSWLGPIRIPSHDKLVKPLPCCSEKACALYELFWNLLRQMDVCMKKIQERVELKSEMDKWASAFNSDQYLYILRELYETLKLYYSGAKLFGGVMERRSSALNYLVVSHAKRGDDNMWILQFKEAISFEARHHLAMMMLPDMKEQFAEYHEMLIDRSQLLSESFEYVGNAEPESLRSGLFMEFKNEEATGQGVLREWFLLVCQAIFNPQNALFVACPTDRRRFYPNPASKVDPLHLEYFNFSGRLIALALMHNIQVGIALDRVFFNKLAGSDITLEDIRDADPYLYSSCKKILEMDPQMVDQDALGLTFVHEVEELGKRKVVELCPNGKSIAVNSRNRKDYIAALIRHLFVVSISKQVAKFAEGFADIAGSRHLQYSFFRWLNAEDLDMMLYGSDKPICVDDWKAHTQYRGFEQAGDQISWFWEIVEGMTCEQKKTLLFFWASLKYLPVEGFKGLSSKLYIYKSSQDSNCLPSSNTCFYRLNLPSYPSSSHMRERLHIITQEHVGCSFGEY